MIRRGDSQSAEGEGSIGNQESIALSKLEKERSVVWPIATSPTTESARGLRQAHAIAGADTRVMGLQLGLIFSNRWASQPRICSPARRSVSSGPCFDRAFPNFADIDGFAAKAEAARRFGLAGKSCIHPSQIATANRIFFHPRKKLRRRIGPSARHARRLSKDSAHLR